MSNFLEDLVAEWYEFQGYFVRRNIPVGKRRNGGYDGELDVVAFNPLTRHLVHVEPSTDCHSWQVRETRFNRKFEMGRKYIPSLFTGFKIPSSIDQFALLIYGSAKGRSTVGGARLVLIGDFMREIKKGLEGREVGNAAVPEQFTILRALQFAANYWPS